MKLLEIVSDFQNPDLDISQQIKEVMQQHGVLHVRVTVQSLSDSWPKEKPKGWGLGCLIKARVGNAERQGIVIRDYGPVGSFDVLLLDRPSAKRCVYAQKQNIVGYGPFGVSLFEKD